MSVDERCKDLALVFLCEGGRVPPPSPEDVEALAETIQRAIEGWIERNAATVGV